MSNYSPNINLNKEQSLAVNFGTGPLMIIAGAGTGKTTVITERIKRIVSEDLAEPSEILALTFTEKAAKEMQDRVDRALPLGYSNLWIMTFHSFSEKIIRKEAIQVGMDPGFHLMTSAESIHFFRKHMFEFNLEYYLPLGNPNKFVSSILQHFSRLQDEDVSPKEYAEWVKNKFKKQKKPISEETQLEEKKYKELSCAFTKYTQLKNKEGQMDFGDLLVNSLNIFRSRKNILAEYKKAFKYILVDEFQDTNIVQNELVKLISGQNGNITVVLDDDQSIYRFRGAAISNAIQFRKSFPNAKLISLINNYRSTQEILDSSYQLIQFNNPDRLEVVEKINKKLISSRKKSGEKVEFIHADRVENEADAVAKKIIDLTSSGEGDEKINFSDIAILVRANNHSDPFVKALERNGVPHQFLGPGKLFKQPEVIELISYLKLLRNFEDSVALSKVLSIDIFNIPARDLVYLGAIARKKNVSLFEVCEKINETYLQDSTKEKINKIIEMIIGHMELAKKESAGQVLYHFLLDSGLMQNLINSQDQLGEIKVQNISKFFDKIKTHEVDDPNCNVSLVVDWLDLLMELGESPLAADVDWTENDAVNILTVHSAKGLEFRIVFLVNLVGQRFPTSERHEQIPIPDELIKEVLPKGDFHIQEERRLFYVGMTRAKDLLFLTAADYYGEGKREKKLSPFIFEALGEDYLVNENKSNKPEQLSFLDYKIKNEVVGDEKSISNFHLDYLSYSQIETFKICPLHYKLRYILKIPTPMTPALSFGITMHECMNNFYQAVKNGKKGSEALLLDSLSSSWIKEGFLNSKHEEKYLNKAKSYLEHYFEKEFNPNNIPIKLEENFIVPIRKNNEFLKIGGKIDRVDDLGGGVIEIIDYKTGERVPEQKVVDKDLQLTFYALAASLSRSDLFPKKPEQIKLSLYYFDTHTKISTTRDKSELDKAVEEIFLAKKEMEISDFKCSGSIICQNCEFSLFCGENT